MSNGPAAAGPRFQFSLRQSIYGWGGLAVVTLSIACFTYWVASLQPRKADFEALYIGGLYWSADHGVIRVRDNPLVSVREMLHPWSPELKSLDPGPTLNVYEHGSSQLDLPGFKYRAVRYEPSGSVYWMLSLSPFIPFGLTAPLAGLCVWRYLAARRGPKSKPQREPEKLIKD